MADTKRYNSVPVLTLADDLSSSGTTIKTTSMLDWGGDALTTASFNTDYIPFTIINDKKTLIEFGLITASTIGDLTTTGATIYKRGLKYFAEGDTTDDDEVTANKLAWTQGAKVLIGTNPPHMYGTFANKFNEETIEEIWTFLNTTIPTLDSYLAPTLDEQLAPKKYVDDTAGAGAADATTTVKGVIELATQAELDAGTDTGGTGASLVAIPSNIADSIQTSTFISAADAGGTDAYAITLTPAISSYTTGQMFIFSANTVNTGAATLDVNSVGAVTIKKNHDQDLEDGDIESGSYVIVIYDGTNFQLQSQQATIPTTALLTQVFSGLSGDVTAANLNTLTAGATSDADALHTHDSLAFPYVGFEIDGGTALYRNTFTESGFGSFPDSVTDGGMFWWPPNDGGGGGYGGNVYYAEDIVDATNDFDITFTCAAAPAGGNEITIGIGDASGAGGSIASSATIDGAWIEVGFGGAFACNADGTTNTNTDITGAITITDYNTYRILRNGTDIEFYVNGTLATTHTTNLPIGTTRSFWMQAIKGNGTAGSSNATRLLKDSIRYRCPF